mmetsp:Transcript_10915/g.16656  ORF Transcript_10915/g.16656 Transcript_10915/m.16656 type:complete len:893 (-) Transcript_10915:686-3364(-)
MPSQEIPASNSSDDDEGCNDFQPFQASLSSPSPSKSQESNKNVNVTTKRMTIQRDRQATLFNRATMEMHRTTRLAMTSGETQGSLEFTVPRNKLLHLPPSTGSDSITTAVRTSLYRRFESLNPERKEDDTPYLNAVKEGTAVKLVKALPKGYERGGWRCHALVGEKECMHPNKAHDKCCSKCNTEKPHLKPAYAHLRLLLPGMRQQRREYVRMIKEYDSELRRCEVAEHIANDKIATFDDKVEKGLAQAEEEEVELTMDVDLIQKGVWQRGNARSLLPMLFDRKNDLNTRLRTARAEIAIMIQCTYELAVIHGQKTVRRYLARCRLDSVRKAKDEFAKFCAVLEIQRVARGKIAKTLLIQLRQLRHCFKATKIQSIARMRQAVLERKRLWSIYFLQLQHQKATVIQSFARTCAAKLKRRQLAELRRFYLEEQEKDRVATTNRNAATRIQSVYRRHLDQIKCENRRIEMSLHGRLLMYLERFAIDGCMWTFVKSINDDYLRFERTIKNVIDREEKMAKTFVEKVVKARDEDHSSAWNNYHSLKEGSRLITQSQDMTKLASAEDKRIHRKSSQCGSESDGRRKMNGQKRESTTQIYKNALSDRNRGPSRRVEMSRRSSPAQSHKRRQITDIRSNDCIYRREAKQISALEQANARLRGQYLRFDIPNGLDDTMARFITAVVMRYDSDLPTPSRLEGNISGSAVRQVEKKRLEYADELIHALHEKGFIFIRQLLPIQHMSSILRDLMVNKDFILLSRAMVAVLQRMNKGNHLTRSYLLTKCTSFLDTQSRQDPETRGTKANQNLDIVSFLGECGAAGCEEEFNDEIPRGLFDARKSSRSVPQLPSNLLLQTNNKTDKSKWTVKFTQKVINDNETKHPAYINYRRGQLLANSIDVNS